MWICEGDVSVRNSRVPSKKKVSRSRPRGMPLRERELVEVELDRLDLPVVPHLVAQPEEGILDGSPDLRDQVQLSQRPLLAGKRDVEVDVLHDVGGELALALLQRLLDPGTRCVQRHPGLAVTYFAQRELEWALAPEVANAELLEGVRVGGARDCGPRLILERRGVHRATIPSAS